MASPWTKAEDDLLIRLRAEGYSYEDASQKMRGRSNISCRVRAQKLGIAVPKPTSSPAKPRTPRAPKVTAPRPRNPLGPKATQSKEERFWTKARVDRLRGLVQAGWSCAEMAGALNTTRNAVMSKVHRLGIVVTGRGGQAKAQVKAETAAIDNLKERYAAAAASVADPLNLTVLEIGHRQCRFPTSEREGVHLMCGHKTAEGRSYCDTHHACTHNAPPDRSKKSGPGGVDGFLDYIGSSRRAVG